MLIENPLRAKGYALTVGSLESGTAFWAQGPWDDEAQLYIATTQIVEPTARLDGGRYRSVTRLHDGASKLMHISTPTNPAPHARVYVSPLDDNEKEP